MTELKKKLDKIKENLVILKHTKHIQKEDKELFPEWYELSEDYKHITAALDKTVVSIKNSIIFQRRLVFCITRDSIAELVRSDKNWKKAGFSNSNYETLLKILVDIEMIQLIKKGEKRVPSVYKVIDKNIRKYIQIDEGSQLVETVDFVNKMYGSDDKQAAKQAAKPDVVGSSKYVAIEDTTSSIVVDRVEGSLLSEAPLKIAGVIETTKSIIDTETPQVANPPLNEHQELLNQALSINTSLLNDFQKSFLIGKQDQLTKYGSFKGKQLDILKQITLKASNKPVVTLLKPSIVTDALKAHNSPEAIYKALKQYAIPERKEKLIEMLSSKFDDEEQTNKLLSFFKLN